MSVKPSKFIAVLLVASLFAATAPHAEAQRDKGQRPQRRTPSTPRPKATPRPQPRSTPRTTPRSTPRSTPRANSRSPQRDTSRPARRTAPRSNARSSGGQNAATNPRSRSSSSRRQPSKRVSSVKRYQDTNSRNKSGRSSTSRNDRGRSNSASDRRADNDRRRRTSDIFGSGLSPRNERQPRTTDRRSRNSSDRRRTTSTTNPGDRRSRNDTNNNRTRSTDRRGGLTVTPLKRQGGLSSRRGSGRTASSGFGSSQPRANNAVPSVRDRDNNRNRTTTSTRRPAFRKKPLAKDQAPSVTRSNRRRAANKKTLGRGGVAVSDDSVIRRKRAAKTTQRRPAALRRLEKGRRGNVVQDLKPVPNRRLRPLSDTSVPAPRERRVRDGRSGAIRSGFRRGVGGGRRHHSNLNFSLFAGGGNWGFGAGFSNHRFYRGGSAFTFGFGGGACYAGSYLHGPGYANYWRAHYFGARPYHLGISSPAHVYYGLQVDFRRRSLLHFGYNYYHPFTNFTPYPFYRTCYYEPWFVNFYARRTPVYRTYYYVQEPVVETVYVETADPFVEEDEVFGVDEIDAVDYNDGFVAERLAPVSRNPVPVAFQSAFSNDVPDGLSYDEGLAWAEEALFNKDYLGAAEAFRRAMKLRWEDDYPKFQLALALFGAERYDLSYLALELGLNQNPAWLYRRFDVRDAFETRQEFTERLSALERYLIRHSQNDEARFVLGYCYFFSGNLFGARSVTRILDDSPRSFPHLRTLAAEAEKRLLSQDR